MKNIKKIICLVLCMSMLLGVSSLLVACGAKDAKPVEDGVLKLYMPGEYIDEDIFELFEAWYKKETGKDITVKIDTFDAVENVQTALEGARANYDLICPSDYMIEYLIKKELLLKIDKSIVNIETKGLFKDKYIETTRQFDPTLEYSVPYMYGTLGLVYDYSKTGKHIDSWESLYGNEFNKSGNDIFKSVKDSIRDAYATACLYNARNTTKDLTGAALKAEIQRIFEDTTQATLDAAETTLKNTLKNAVWDVDDVKYLMAANNTKVAVALMWSCDAGYVMNTYEDEDGVEHDGNRNLWYVVPKEGGNVYIDSFAISKYAKNVEAANYFLKFICQKDIAVKNSEYAGAISPVADAYDELLEYYTEDEDGIFEDTEEGWKEMFIETMFPSDETLNRCGVMKDFGDGKTRVTRMWGNVQ